MPSALRDVGIVAIGRNEGARLLRCFDAFPDDVRGVVYVDSASTDGSAEHARGRGFEVLQLDLSVPFTAARARNAGLRRLRARWPELRYVQFIDGDCALAPGWLEPALRQLETDPKIAVVCGRRREIHPEASVYNRLCDAEWNTPVGEAESCGGDALARIDAVLDAGGFDERVISGEEPELCARLRGSGWKIRRADCEMTLHDAGITRFDQWWRRAVRSGHGFAQVNDIDRAVFARERRSSVIWGAVLPAGILMTAPALGGLALAFLLAYAALGARIFFRRIRSADTVRDAALYALFCVLAKFPEGLGVAKYTCNRMRNRRATLIEYK